MGTGYDLYYSIHSNAIDISTVRGTEVWDSVENLIKVSRKYL